MQFRCPNCKHPIKVEDAQADTPEETIDTIECPSCHSRFSLSVEGSSSTFVVGALQKIGHFEIREVVGEGAFGTVLKAWDPELERLVAIKIPRDGRTNNNTSRLFLREARAAAAITHPNVVGVYEVGQHEDSFYIASEFIDGISLSEQLKIRTFSPVESAELLIKLLRAVQVFHDKSIIHRDLKPGNILIDQVNEPHITDFGLARIENPNELTVTNSGRIIGTLLYMPPEQARGETRKLSNRSDIYAMGVVLYEMLTGQRPFQASSSRTLLHTILTVEPSRPRGLNLQIPKDLETVCLKAIEKDPGKRYASAGEMADDLKRFLDGQPILARPVGLPEKCWRWMKRNPLSASLVCLALMLSVGVVYLAIRGQTTKVVESPPVIVEVPGKPVTFPVSISYQLTGSSIPAGSKADWAIIPLNPRTRDPDDTRAQQFQDQTTVSADLAPGEYLVVVDVDGFGFHEVYRSVPDDPKQVYRPNYRHQRWDLGSDGQVLWPEVTVLRDTTVTQGMVEVPAGTFLMGDDQPDRPVHQRTVNSFFVDPTEVTVGQFLESDRLPDDYPAELNQENLALVMISVHAATAWAELRGKRLLSEDEFEYLATNLGHNKYPHGDQPLFADGSWPYGPVGTPESDKMVLLPIFGLHSNVAEWTGSSQNLYPGQKDPGSGGDLYMRRLQNRIVRGGPVVPGPNDRTQNQYSAPTTKRAGWDSNTRDTEIGFRCARSRNPYTVKMSTL
ncbi:MAG: protein kinase [Planctomyces sp.]|nr:protein kinase [Planctomyces sp.]